MNLYPKFHTVKKKDKFLIKSLFSKSQSSLLLLIQTLSLPHAPCRLLLHNNNDTRLRQGERKIKKTNLYRQENENILLILLKLCVLLKLWVRNEKKKKEEPKKNMCLWAFYGQYCCTRIARQTTAVEHLSMRRRRERECERETRKNSSRRTVVWKYIFIACKNFKLVPGKWCAHNQLPTLLSLNMYMWSSNGKTKFHVR